MAHLDLNLVRVFVALYDTSSVTAAAQRLGVTQPTVSYGLGKLRDGFGDRLFLRSPKGLVPTAAAERAYRSFSSALADIEGTLQAGFEPALSDRRFRVAMSDLGALCVLPPLLARLQAAAPATQLEAVQLNLNGLVDDLASGKLDAAIGNLPALREQTRSELLFHEHYVCVISRDHPSIGESLSIEEFVGARHAMASAPSSGQPLVQQTLAEHGIERKLALRVPHFSVLPQLIAGSELLTTVPSRIAQLFVSQASLRILQLPVTVKPFEVRVHWHPRQEGSAAGRWLVRQIAAATADGLATSNGQL
jgi:DNA-binding transcriptional LysR family regulator